MSALILQQIEPQENIEELKVQLRAELDECTEVAVTLRNKVIKFMIQERIWHISELNYELRNQYREFLLAHVQGKSTIFQHLKAFDRVKLHSIRDQGRLAVEGKKALSYYKNEIFYLPYHPNPVIAERFSTSFCRPNMLWDFQREASEHLKRQIFYCLHDAIEKDKSESYWRLLLAGIKALYDFCVENHIADIETMELEQERHFVELGDTKLNRHRRTVTVHYCRKSLFMEHADINWDAHVWYLERFHIQPERIDQANKVVYLSFMEVTHKQNRALLKEYMKYGLGITNLSMKSLRGEFVYVRKFLMEVEQSENENICMISPEQMDVYFKKEKERSVQDNTFNQNMMAILHFFNFLRVRQYIEWIPFDEKRYLKKVVYEHHDRSVEEKVVNEILEKLHMFPEVPRLMFLHLWGIGLRISEVCVLKGNAYYIQGDDAWIQVYQTKMRRYKCVPIPAALYKLMIVYIKKYDIKAEEYLFKNRKGDSYNSRTFSWMMVKCCKENEIQDGEYAFKSHDYRHNLATYFYDAGVSLQSIRDYLGHAYEEMTQQYIDYMPKKIDAANEEYFCQHSLASCLRKKVIKNGEENLST